MGKTDIISDNPFRSYRAMPPEKVRSCDYRDGFDPRSSMVGRAASKPSMPDAKIYFAFIQNRAACTTAVLVAELLAFMAFHFNPGLATFCEEMCQGLDAKDINNLQ